MPHNPLRADPTRSATLRRLFVTEFTKRFERLKGKILKLIVDEDAFGLLRVNNEREDNERSEVSGFGYSMQGTRAGSTDYAAGIESVDNIEQSISNGQRQTTGQSRRDGEESRTIVLTRRRTERNQYPIIENTRWQFKTAASQLDLFTKWLEREIKKDILPTTKLKSSEAYWQKYVEDGYRKGQGRAFTDVRKPAVSASKDFFEGTKDEFLRAAFGRPAAIEKVKLLASRVFTDLKGVTEAMSTQMGRVLADGLNQGQNPHVIAKNLNERITKIGQNRSTVMARTEITRAHAEGQIDALEELGVEEVGVQVEWSTAGDERVCPLCQPMEGVVLKLKEARGIIPRHPQCRCAFLPANVGESKIGQKRTKSKIDSSIDRSIKAEVPAKGRSLAERKKVSRSVLADKKISKKRPKSQI
jgi:SPP1 gp7 family putative phage head morphogenesis protein